MPTSLVDLWPATEKYEKERAAGAFAAGSDYNSTRKPHTSRSLRKRNSPKSLPDSALPEDTGVFVLDGFQGEPQPSSRFNKRPVT